MTNAPIWYVYIIRGNDNSLYTGVSINVERRFLEHQSQGKKCAKYLRGKAPLRLVFQQKMPNKTAAYQLEYQIKQMSKADKEKLIIIRDLRVLGTTQLD
ncbi:MAG: GIY-YIG nuclease family protein [Alphaproteobacteria bacterium]|jgi:putative endonuclease|nr:GIY-YIG nuclease family protein [Alphaproteobacteria bacterium]MBP9877257.1 GIY-YIG nuclease family protein [Alphaproteobacteria bacterium]